MRVIILTGPTASGKTALALEIAREVGGEIVNADSMQLYRYLPILTACPTLEEKSMVSHHLFQILGGQDISSAGWWVEQAVQQIKAIHQRGRIPIIVGGTGMYLKSLTDGLSSIPEIPQALREQARSLAELPDFYEQVMAIDPMVDGRLKTNDLQRLTRAYEVKLATGRSIFEWQEDQPKLLPYDFDKMVIVPDKDWLHNRINLRLDLMVEQGALQEVENLLQQDIRPDSPILRAVGVKEFKAYLQNDVSLGQAIELAKISTRQYAKRQMTWIRGQAKNYKVINVGN